MKIGDVFTVKWPNFVVPPDEISVVLTPSLESDIELSHDQSWFWTDEWQAMEAEADRDLAEGRFEIFNTIEELLESLDDDRE